MNIGYQELVKHIFHVWLEIRTVKSMTIVGAQAAPGEQHGHAELHLGAATGGLGPRAAALLLLHPPRPARRHLHLQLQRVRPLYQQRSVRRAGQRTGQ